MAVCCCGRSGSAAASLGRGVAVSICGTVNNKHSDFHFVLILVLY